MTDNQYLRDAVHMRIEFDIAAQKCLNQVIIQNETIAQQLEEGIKRAFERFDFVEIVEAATIEAIKSEIRKSTEWGKLRDLVRKKADEIVDAHVEKELEKLKNSL